MGVCYIVGAGEFVPRGLKPQEGDYVIAADGGLRALESVGIRPDLLMGDLDSLGSHPLPAGIPLEQFPVEKDDTDTGIALAQGYAIGYREFALYGCGGGRTDHLLANFQSMCRYSKRGCAVRLIAKDYDAYALTNGSLTLPPRESGTIVSVFCHGDKAEGVTLRGLYYPLDDYTLTCDHPLGVSNQHTDSDAEITVRDGTLLILQHLYQTA
ncbi:MAG: thiamine diphosphokinase [Clostridia bacterium]|nr:thiamine diphosphokinase [Clostridia bacterium]